MRLKNFFFAFCSIALLYSLTSCGAMVKSMAVSKITVENNAIPPDIGKDESILVCVIYGRKSHDKYMKKHVINEYHGKYEFVLKDELGAVKYKDTSKYRYRFSSNVHNSSISIGDEYARVKSTYFIIADMKEEITYKCPVSSGFFSRIIQAYMINLEKERLKFNNI